MIFLRNSLLILFLSAITFCSFAAVTRSIRSFGAKGDGITNDQDAFQKAAEFFNKNGGNGKLIIPTGTYLVGRQTPSKTPDRYLLEEDIFYLKNATHFSIEGSGKVKIKYADKLRFGSFNPADGTKFTPKSMPFFDASKLAQLGCLFRFEDCSFISVINVEADGNNTNMIIGGPYGDMGIQLWHYGLHLTNCHDINITQTNMHHFCLDGLMIKNSDKENAHIILSNSSFNYNGRQGFSLVGGKGIMVRKCSFNHTGQAGVDSPPHAGVDIEAEGGNTISDGLFENCTFINNKGCGLLADNGESAGMTFKNCTFWGIDNWSIWVVQKAYSFYNCAIFGSLVHGCYTSNYAEATKFFSCVFKDSAYNGREPYGKFLLECDTRKKMVFDQCSFIARHKQIMWYNGVGSKAKEDQVEFKHCTMEANGKKEALNN